jgi:hypothetical protein
MPGAEYDTEGPTGLRKLTGSSSGRAIGTGFQSLGNDIEKYLPGVVTHATSFTVAPGELVKLGASISISLGAAGVVGVLPSELYTAKISAGVGHTISGGGLPGAVEEIKVLPGQSVLIRVFGNNGYIIAGECAEGRAVRTTIGGGAARSLLSWGFIHNEGAIEAGSGDYTVANPTTGTYEITFNTAKASAKYAVIVTNVITTFSGVQITAQVVINSASKFTIYTQVAGTLTSDSFCFQAIAAS